MPKVIPYLVATGVLAAFAVYLGNVQGDWKLGFLLFTSVFAILLVAFWEDQKSSPSIRTPVVPKDQTRLQLDGLREDVKAVSDAMRLLCEQKPATPPPASEDLKGAVSTLAQELGVREKESQRMLDLLIQKDHKRILARLASIRETAEFTRRIVANGKLDEKEALNQLTMEIEDAFNDLGLEILQISPEIKISELPAAGFTAVSAEEASDPTLAGTVKESLCDAIYITDGEGRRAFIAPAKLKLYKL
jgi:hypothetical protein